MFLFSFIYRKSKRMKLIGFVYEMCHTSMIWPICPFQVWPAPASHASAPCLSSTAILETCVTTPAETISPTGCRQRLLFPWCPWKREKLNPTSAAARYVKLPQLPSLSTARTSPSQCVRPAGAACGSATRTSWWVLPSLSCCCQLLEHDTLTLGKVKTFFFSN